MGLNHAAKGLNADVPPSLPGPGELSLEDNVPAMEYLMLAGGQFFEIAQACSVAAIILGTI